MQTTFDAPSGTDPVALNLASMGKGEAWVNGESNGQYWVSFKTPAGQQNLQYSYLHDMRWFFYYLWLMNYSLQVSCPTIVLESYREPPCSLWGFGSDSQLCIVSDSTIKSWREKQQALHLRCHERRSISSVEFASYGSPQGDSENNSIWSCHSLASKNVAKMVRIWIFEAATRHEL